MTFNIGDVTIGVRIDQSSIARSVGILGKASAALYGVSAAGASAGGAVALLPAVLSAAAVSGGTLALALSGVGGALKGYAADQKTASKASGAGGQAAAASARQIRDAQTSIDDARRNAAKVARDSSERVQDARRAEADTARDVAERIQEAQRDEAATARSVAESIANARERLADTAQQGADKMEDASRRVSDAMEGERDAQQDLTAARVDAAGALDDLRERVSDFAITEESAAIRVERARESLTKTEADASSSALDLRDARNDLASAEERLSDVQRDRLEQTAGLAEAERLGIDGSEKVVNAQEKLLNAQEKVANAQREAGRTARDVAEANTEAAERVAKAVMDGAEKQQAAARATAEAQRDGAEKQQAASRAVAEAQRDGAEAQQDAARAVADAVQNLADVQGDQASSAQAATTATNAYGDAMAKLSPSTRDFVKSLIGMGPAFRDMKMHVQEKFFAGLSTEVEKLGGAYLPVMKRGLGLVAGEMNLTTKSVSAFLLESQSIADTNRGLDNTAALFQNMRPGVVNLTAVWRDLSVVGSEFFPQMGTGFSNLTGEFRGFIERVRASGELRDWIQASIDNLTQLGRIARNSGEMLVSIFGSAAASTGDLMGGLESVTERLNIFLKSGEGRSFMLELFGNLRKTADNLSTGFGAAGGAFADMMLRVTQMLPAAAQLFSSVVVAALPFFQIMGTLSGAVLPVVAQGLQFVVDKLGFLIPVAAGAVAVFKGIALWGVYAAGVARLSAQLGVMAGAMLGSMTRGAGVANVLNGIGRALPVVGLAAIGLGVLFDALGSKSDELADQVVGGSISMVDAIRKEAAQIDAASLSFDEAGAKAGEWATATENVRREVAALEADMGPLELATSRVRQAQANYDAALRDFPATSEEVRQAALLLAQATTEEERAQLKAKNAANDRTQALRNQQDQMLGMQNADLQHRQDLHALTQAEKDATAAIRDHGVGSDQAKEAGFRLEEAQSRVTTSGQRLSDQMNTNRTSTEKAKAATDQFRDTQIFLAATLGDRASPSVQNFARDLKQSDLNAHNAAVETSGFDFAVRKLPDGRQVYIRVDHEGNEISDVHHRIDVLPRFATVKIEADGSVVVPGKGRLTAFASGGILPGYTPGRDTMLASGPSGPIALGGGEAIMRPEWTRAIGAGWINGANEAARSGGVKGVQRYMAAPSGRNGEGRVGDSASAAFALGGVVRRNAGDVVPMRHEDNLMMYAKWYAKQGGGDGTGGNPLAWARTQNGKPYQWAGVGNPSWDCSGFMSGIVNVMRGKSPFSRVGGTGTFPWPGFRPGIGPGLSIGSRRGNPGHMAGTIGGVNVESSGSGGVQVGGRARGAADPLFTTRYHLPFDDGGVATGRGLMTKDVMAPERVLSPAQTESFDRLVTWLDRNGSGPGKSMGDVHVHLEQSSGSPAETGRFVALALRGVG